MMCFFERREGTIVSTIDNNELLIITNTLEDSTNVEYVFMIKVDSVSYRPLHLSPDESFKLINNFGENLEAVKVTDVNGNSYEVVLIQITYGV